MFFSRDRPFRRLLSSLSSNPAVSDPGFLCDYEFLLPVNEGDIAYKGLFIEFEFPVWCSLFFYL